MNILLQKINKRYIYFDRKLIKAFVTKPGDGPSEESMRTGFLDIGFWGKGKDVSGKEVVVRGGVIARGGDPGYR